MREYGINYLGPDDYTDSLWGKVLFCLNAAGEDGNTSITEAKGNAVTVNGDAKVKTTLGYPAFYFDGTVDSIQVATTSDFLIGTTTDFCIDFFFWYPGSSISFPPIFSSGYSTWTYGAFNSVFDAPTTGADKLNFSYYGGPTLGPSSSTYAYNTLHHGGIQRVGTTLKMLMNGSVVATGSSNVDNFNFPGDTGKVMIGGSTHGSAERFTGYIPAIRLTKGDARFGTTYQIPSFPFPTR